MSQAVLFYRKVRVPLYFGFLHIAVASDLSAAVKQLGIGREGDPTDMSGYNAITTERTDKNGLTHWYALFRPDSEPGVIAHEAKHIVNFIFISRGLKLDPMHDEHECYLLGWVVEQIHNALSAKKA